MESGGASVTSVIQKWCDICGKEVPNRYVNVPIIDLTIAEFKGAAIIPTHYDFCPECSKYMSEKIKAAMQERKGAQT